MALDVKPISHDVKYLEALRLIIINPRRHAQRGLHLFTKHLVNYNVDTIVGWLENKNYKNLFELAEAIASLKF